MQKAYDHVYQSENLLAPRVWSPMFKPMETKHRDLESFLSAVHGCTDIRFVGEGMYTRYGYGQLIRYQGEVRISATGRYIEGSRETHSVTLDWVGTRVAAMDLYARLTASGCEMNDAEVYAQASARLLIVTRHPALVQVIHERGLAPVGTTVLEHVCPDDVRDKDVIGVLPLHLAAVACTVTELPMRLTKQDRDDMKKGDLSVERTREVAGEAVTYVVRGVL